MTSLSEARTKAEIELRHEIGSRPYLDEVEENEDAFVFPICYRYVDISSDEPVFYEGQRVGQISVHKEGGGVSRPSLDTIEENIAEVRRDVEDGEIESLDSEEVSY